MNRDDLLTQAAAIAFYAMCSLAPLAVVILVAASFLPFSSSDELTLRISDTLGRDWCEALQLIFQGARQPKLRGFAGVLAITLSLFLASSVLVQMRSVMDRIFESGDLSIHAWAVDRLIGGGLLILTIFGFTLSMLAIALLGVFESLSLRAWLPLSGIVTTASSVVFLAVLFRFLPRRRPPWSLCFQGGLLCAFLLKFTDSLFSHYVRFAAIKSSYGVAGTLAAFLLWIYASSIIFLLIAEFLYFSSRSQDHSWRSLWARLRHSRHPVLGASLIGLLAVLAVARLMLPEIIRYRVNEELNHDERWRGYVDEVDLALWRGALSFNGIHLQAKEKDFEVACAQASLDISMFPLLRGDTDLGLVLRQPEGVVRFLAGRPKGSGPGPQAPRAWPVTLSRLRIEQGSLRVKDHTSLPLPTLRFSDIELQGTALAHGAEARFTARTSGKGLLTGVARVDTAAPLPRWKAEIEWEHVSLVPLNLFLLKHAGLDLEKGEMDAAIALVGAGWQVHGTIKPIFANLRFTDHGGKERSRSFWRRLWEHIVRSPAGVPAPRGAAARGIVVSGRLDGTRANALTALARLLRDGFVDALAR